ncbi:hypothetical protein V5F59_04795 [Xanthobacter autotrophicus DSM 431]|uniref:hypothetical protein n=1 Tax=Xanthobacter nonsaccharivorans TaxID=3119912 RepID=UPI003726DD09
MSTLHPSHDGAPAGAELYRLAVEAEGDPNALLRLLEPFVIHAVLPHRVDCAASAGGLSVEVEFSAPPDLALRLKMRLATMVCVRDAELARASSPGAAGRLGAAA